MKSCSRTDAENWCESQGFPTRNGKPSMPSSFDAKLSLTLPAEAGKIAWLARYIETTLQPRDRCLLWVLDWGIWPSSENWHLYYAFMKSCGDFQLIEDSPAHLFLNYERETMVSAIHLALIFGWEFCVIPSSGFASITASHDGRLEISFSDPNAAAAVKRDLSIAAIN